MVSLFLKATTFIWVSLFCVSVVADALPKPILRLQQAMQGKQKISGDFQQERVIPSMNTKLRSEGTFEIRKPQQVRWHQASPFLSTFLISKDKATLTLAESAPSDIDLRTQPAMLAVGQILSGLFLGNTKSIQPYFTVEDLPRDPKASKKWTFKLIPKQELMKKVLEPIRVSGALFIENLEIRNKSGNLTKIRFSNVKTQ